MTTKRMAATDTTDVKPKGGRPAGARKLSPKTRPTKPKTPAEVAPTALAPTAIGRRANGHPTDVQKQYEARYLAALNQVIPPERLGALVNETIAFAQETHSWRGMLAVLKLTLAYGIGRPTQRISVSTVDYTELLRYLKSEGDDSDEDGTGDGDYVDMER